MALFDYSFKIVISGALYPNYFLVQNANEELAIREVANHDPFKTVMVSVNRLYYFVC